MDHKCRVYWFYWRWEIICPSCGLVGWRFEWRNAITRALGHIRAQHG